MTIRTVGVAPAAYTDHEGAVLASSSADEIRTDTSGVYPGQRLDVFAALDDITFTRSAGVVYTIGLDTSAALALRPGDGWSISDCTITGTANRLLDITGAGKSVLLEGVDFYFNAGHTASMFYTRDGNTLTMRNCRVNGDTIATTYAWISVAGATINFDNVYVADEITCANGLIHAFNSTTVITISGFGHGVSDLVGVALGATVSTLTATGCYAPNMVTNAGTITAFAGDFSAYNTTAAGTENATYQDGGITDFDLDWRGWPNPSSPLFRLMPANQTVGASSQDANRNPRYTGGRADCGPFQNQTQVRLPIEVWA